MEKIKAMTPRQIIYFVLALLCALNAIFNMASCGDLWASSEVGKAFLHISLWKIVYNDGQKEFEYTIEEYCDDFGACTNFESAVSTGRGATILGFLFYIPAACVYAYLAAKDKARPATPQEAGPAGWKAGGKA